MPLSKLRKVQRRFVGTRTEHFSVLSGMALFLLYLAGPALLHSETISGTVADQSGAVIVGARIEITGGDLAQPVVLSSDGLGKFSSPDLKPGTYSIQVTREGFEPLVKPVDLRNTVQLQLTLAIAKQRVEISVSGKGAAFANADPVYRKLRDLGLGQTFRLDNFTMQMDAATFRFQKGSLTILSPVNGVVTGAIYIGAGHFNLKPVTGLDALELKRRAGDAEVNEDFSEVVFRFSGQERGRLLSGVGDQVETPADAATIFEHWKERVRKRYDGASSFTEYLLHGETMDNVDAGLLAAVYNPSHPSFLNAYIRGKQHKDFRFFVRTRVGALPQLDSPEEVAVINYDPAGMDDGIWYLAHLKSEYADRTASSDEYPRLFAKHGYKIETVISKNDHLFGTATVTFQPLIAGERVLKFGLLPNLRVTRVTDDQGQDIYFVQESRKN